MRGKSAFTLIEVLAVCLILIIAVVGTLGVFSVSFSLNQGSKNTIIALSDASSVLESMRNIDPFSIASLLAGYPNGSTLGGYANLSSETVQVNYADTSADPLQATVTVTWHEKTRVRTEKLVALFTGR